MDSLYARLHQSWIYGAFLRQCRWAIEPVSWRWPLHQLALIRIIVVALTWGALPLMLVTPLFNFLLGVAGASAEGRELYIGALCLATALFVAPIILRSLLMPLAWFPAILVLLGGNAAPAARVQDEMQKQYDDWIAEHG